MVVMAVGLGFLSIDILTEGSFAAVACLEPGAAPCARSADCRTLPVWRRLDGLVNEYLDSVRLSEICPPARDETAPPAPQE